MDEFGKFIIVNSKFISSDGTIAKYSNKQICPLYKNDIVMVMSDVPKGKAIAKCLLIDTDNKYTLNQRICSLRAKEAPFFYLLQINRNDYFLKFDDGVKQTNLRKEDILSCPIYKTMPQEQQKIADFLSLVDERIEKQRQLVEVLKRYKRGLLISIFSKTNCTKHVLLGDIANIYQPATISQSEFNNGIYKVFGANGYIGYYNRFNHEKEQVTISCRGEKCGTVNLVEPCSWITGNSMVVNIDNNSDILKRYLYHCLSSQNLKYLISGSAQPQIIRSDLMRHRIPLVGLQSQSKISDIFDKLDQIIGFSEVQLLHIQKVKNGLLQQMFI